MQFQAAYGSGRYFLLSFSHVSKLQTSELNLLAVGETALVKSKAVLEVHAKFDWSVCGFGADADRLSLPFDRGLEVARFGIRGGEGVKAVGVFPTGQLTGICCLSHGALAVADIR